VTIMAEGAEDAVAAYGLAELTDPTFRARRAVGASGDEGRLLAELDDLEGRRRDLAAMFAEGELDAGEWKAARGALEGRERALRAELDRHARAGAVASLPPDPVELERFWEGLGWSRRRAILDAVLEAAEVKPAEPGNGDAFHRIAVRLRA
jgi:hypothetical protein